jgi:hypothetical protein
MPVTTARMASGAVGFEASVDAIVAAANWPELRMASTVSCSLPAGKWWYIEPLGAPLSATTWLSPVAWKPWR